MDTPFSELRSPILISVGILERESIDLSAFQLFRGFPRQIFGDPDRFPKKNFIFDHFLSILESSDGVSRGAEPSKKVARFEGIL